jgi:hypothetical protein
MMKPKGRPSQNKEKVTLSINKEILAGAKAVAEKNNKSLSQLTEDLYQDVYRKFKGLIQNPDEVLREIEAQIKRIREDKKINI